MYQDFPQCQTNSGCDVNKTWVLFWKCCLFVLDDISIQVFIYVLFLNHLTCTFTWTYTSFGVYVIYISQFSVVSSTVPPGSRHLRHQQANSSKLPIAGWLGSTFGANPRLSEWLRSVSHVLWNRGNGRYRGIPDEGWDEFMSVTPINNNGRKYGREINKGMWIKQNVNNEECMSSWIKRKKQITGMDGWRGVGKEEVFLVLFL